MDLRTRLKMKNPLIPGSKEKKPYYSQKDRDIKITKL